MTFASRRAVQIRSPAMETRPFLALLAVGMTLLALGGAVGGSRDAKRSGMGPLGLALRGAGLAVLTYAIYRLVKGNHVL